MPDQNPDIQNSAVIFGVHRSDRNLFLSVRVNFEKVKEQEITVDEIIAVIAKETTQAVTDAARMEGIKSLDTGIEK